MHISRIRVKNFKSFKEIDLELGDLNVFVGANASGKSNLVNVFSFLRNIAQHGLENAISLEGGADYLLNTAIGIDRPLEVLLCFKINLEGKTDKLLSNYTEGRYSFSIQFHDDYQFEVIKDNLIFSEKPISFEDKSVLKTDYKKLLVEIIRTNGEDTIIHKYGRSSYPIISVQSKLNYKDTDFEQNEKSLFLENPFFNLTTRNNCNWENLAIYDFDPNSSKKSTSIMGLRDLDEDGGNLSLVIKNILQNKDLKRKFLNLTGLMLPFVGDLRVNQGMDKSVLFGVKESYSNGSDVYMPASFLSNGTINAIALIVALYFEESAPKIFEEPERNLHPKLLAQLMDIFGEVAEKKQIIITTHNPELVRHAPLENLFLVSRDKEGFSTIKKPIDNHEVQVFLDGEVGIAELFVQDLLEFGDGG